jgi:alpha-L-arabinofuranosidase
MGKDRFSFFLRLLEVSGVYSRPGFSRLEWVTSRRVVTLSNHSLDVAVGARLRLAGGAQPKERRGFVLTHSVMHATNTFQNPNTVVPLALPVSVAGDTVSINIPKQAVVSVELQVV